MIRTMDNICGSADNKTTEATRRLISKRQIVVDTDVGFDDLFALTILLGSPIRNNIKLITTVHGMTDPVLGAKTIRRLLARFGRDDIVVVAGGEYVTEEGMNTLTVHDWFRDYQESYAGLIEQLGLPDAVEDSNSESPSKTNAANAIVSTCSQGATTVLCLGPLTNIAAAIPALLEVYPKDFDLVIMGGAVNCKGNTGPDNEAEVNFFCSPRAAHEVFVAAGRIFQSVSVADLATANETHCETINAFVRERREGSTGDGTGPIVASLLAALTSVHPTSSGYDPITTAFLLNPAAISTSKYNVIVDAITGVSSSVGAEHPDAATISLATELDIVGFLDILKEIY